MVNGILKEILVDHSL